MRLLPNLKAEDKLVVYEYTITVSRPTPERLMNAMEGIVRALEAEQRSAKEDRPRRRTPKKPVSR